jgi:Zn-finger nucleic acid-binding protein
MQCPVDQTVLQMTDRQGVEVDYCPTCRGVWLDRGELDKIIDRSAGITPPPPQRSEATYDDRRESSQRYPDQRTYKKKRKESFLGDLFDF